MNRCFRNFTGLMLLVVTSCALDQSPKTDKQVVKDELIIQLNSGQEQDLQQILDTFNLNLVSSLFDFYVVQVKNAPAAGQTIELNSEAAKETEALQKRMALHPSIRMAMHHKVNRADLNVVTESFGCYQDLALPDLPNDPILTWQWHLGPYPGANVEAAWRITKGSQKNSIGIVDSNFYPRSSDLVSYREADGRCDSRCYEFVEIDADEDASDHGSVVASTVGACTDNDLGAAGVDQISNIIGHTTNFKTLSLLRSISLLMGSNPCGPTDFDDCERLVKDVDVINTSAGSQGLNHAVVEISTADKLLPSSDKVWVASAGNKGISADDHFPSAIPAVISVGATDQTGKITDFSNFGNRVDILAPGDNIAYWESDSVTYHSGTSFSAPLIAGVISLMKSVYPQDQLAEHWNWKVAKYLLQKTAKPRNCNDLCYTDECRDVWCNRAENPPPGLVDAEEAVKEAAKGLPFVPLLDSDKYLLVLEKYTKMNHVSAQRNNVYAATDDGLLISTDGGLSFVRRTTKDGLGDNQINAVVTDDSGTIYAATKNGLSISKDSGRSFVNRTTNEGLGSNDVKDVFVADSSKKIYAATTRGLSISSNEGASFINYADDLANYWTTGVFVHQGVIFVATISGLSVSKDQGKTFAHERKGNSLNAVFVDKTGHVYLATDSGLSISGDGGKSFINRTTAQGLGSNKITDVFVDDKRIIYATTNNGLSISRDGGATFVNRTNANGLVENDVSGVFVTNDGTVYLASYFGFVISRDGGETFGRFTAHTLSIFNRGGAPGDVTLFSNHPGIEIKTPALKIGATKSSDSRIAVQIVLKKPNIGPNEGSIQIRAKGSNDDKYIDRHEVLVLFQ